MADRFVADTHHSTYIAAPPAVVYAALLDPAFLARWRVPEGMRCTVHTFEAREGGAFRVSLTYDAPDARGKSSEHTDTYSGHFEQLVPDRCIVERLAFETDLPAMQGEMQIATQLTPEGEGTRLTAVHSGLPPGVSPEDNQSGWTESLGRLAALLRGATSG